MSVLPLVTSMPELAALRLKVRAVLNVSVARKPLVALLVLMRTTLVESPRAPSLATERKPPVMSMIADDPPKVLVPERASVPAPALVITMFAAPVMPPEITPDRLRPSASIEALAPLTL